MLKHIVMFQIKDCTAEKALHFKTILEALNPLVPELDHLEAGIDVLGSDRSMDLVVYSEFKDMAALQAYQIHPEHQKVVAWVKENCSLIKAVDYEI